MLFAAPLHVFGNDSPSRTVEEFYAWAIHPSPADQDRGLAAARKFLGQEIFAALEAQRSYEKVCSRLVPEDIKPHMLDQSPFFLWPDKAKALESTQTVVNGNVARVSVRLAYDDLEWTDTVTLERRSGEWAILNIEWQEGGSLTGRLMEFSRHRCWP